MTSKPKESKRWVEKRRGGFNKPAEEQYNTAQRTRVVALRSARAGTSRRAQGT